MNNILFSSIGLRMDDHPIYEIAMRNPTIKFVQLFASDELHPSDRDVKDSVENSYNEIEAFFKKSNIKIEHLIQYDMTNIEENSIKMASLIINTFNNFSECNIVLDLSTARVPIKLALTRAGEIAFNYLQNQYLNDKIQFMPNIKCATRPSDKGIVEYNITNFQIPKNKDQELLFFLNKNKTKLSQTAIYQKLDWKNQSEVSKSLQRLVKMGYAIKETRSLTPNGKNLIEFLQNVTGIDRSKERTKQTFHHYNKTYNHNNS